MIAPSRISRPSSISARVIVVPGKTRIIFFCVCCRRRPASTQRLLTSVAVCPAQPADLVQVSVCRDLTPPFPLYRFEDHGGYSGIQFLPDGMNIVVRHEPIVGHEGVEPLPVACLAGGRCRADRPAVEALFARYHVEPPGDLSGELDCRVVRLRTAVRKEDTGQTGRESPTSTRGAGHGPGNRRSQEFGFCISLSLCSRIAWTITGCA